MIKENCLSRFKEKCCIARKMDMWWISIDKNTKQNTTWEEFEEIFPKIWIKDSKWKR